MRAFLHEEIAKIVNQGSESTVDHRKKEVQELLENIQTCLASEKRLLTPALDKKYYVLSNEGEKILSKYLFGEQEDLEKRMKEIDDSVKLGNKIGSVKVRDLAKLIGKLIAAEHGVLYAPLFCKTLEIQKDFELKINKGNFDRIMKLSKEPIDCVNWWILNLPYSFKPIVFKSPDRKNESNSSMIGYGAHDVIKNLDISAGIDMTIFSPHSTRGACTSYVSGKIPIDTILRTAGWRKDSVYRKHYKRPTTNDSTFSNEVLNSTGK
ncbi:unnamed protein product [Mytilus coruscus]|uniref:Tyr recombinase domain-containing protein n=1 Tax=Mytilus coruscus TaxID=42192 RepID=A0A6J8B1P8_MYTCO|nr:unnamed protein product [Mytilus coruscus]